MLEAFFESIQISVQKKTNKLQKWRIIQRRYLRVESGKRKEKLTSNGQCISCRPISCAINMFARNRTEWNELTNEWNGKLVTHTFLFPQKYVPNVENKFGTNRTHTHPSANGKLKHCLYPEYNINRMKRIVSISHRIASHRIVKAQTMNRVSWHVVNKSIDFSVAILIISFRPIYDSFAQLFFLVQSAHQWFIRSESVKLIVPRTTYINMMNTMKRYINITFMLQEWRFARIFSLLVRRNGGHDNI